MARSAISTKAGRTGRSTRRKQRYRNRREEVLVKREQDGGKIYLALTRSVRWKKAAEIHWQSFGYAIFLVILNVSGTIGGQKAISASAGSPNLHLVLERAGPMMNGNTGKQFPAALANRRLSRC